MIRFIGVALVIIGCFADSVLATTHYVAKPGTSVSGAWVGHWTTIDDVNLGMSSGDTVFFGTGIWRDARLDVVGGVNGDRTVYACSSFAATNMTGDYHFAKIFASTAVGGWSVYSGSIYTTATVVSGNLFAGQKLLLKKGSSNILPGQWWTDGSTETRVWLSDGSDPRNTYMEKDAGRTTIRVDNQDHVTVWGLDVRYGNNRNIEASVASNGEDSVFIVHCKVGPCAGDFSSNPGNIYSGTTSAGHNHWEIRACSLGAAYALNVSSLQHTHGASILTYSQDSLLVDSCKFYGYHTLATVFNKNDNGLRTYNNVYRYNEFTSENPGAELLKLFRGKLDVEVYGNVFRDHAGDAIADGFDRGEGGNHSLYNNTFINVDIPYSSCKDTEGNTRKPDIRFKYNVMYNATSTNINLTSADLGNPPGPTIIDNNLYFTGNAIFSSGGCGSTPIPTIYALYQWQALGWDINSTVLPASSQDFTNLAGGIYDRQSSPTEMDTVYGGQRWRWYGAIQSAVIDTTPHLALSRGNLSFTVEEAAALPSAQTFNITNTGIGTLDWSISDDASWLNVSPTSGSSNSATITVSINTTNLGVGTYNGIITVSSTNADNSPLTVNVTYNVTTSIPRISLSATSMSFSAVLNGQLPAAQTFVITNIGGGTLDWTVSDDAVWLDLWPVSGSGNSDTVTVSINTTALQVGTYPATIMVSSTNGDNSPQTISVSFAVSLTPVGISAVGSWSAGLTHTMAAGTDRLLVLAVGWEDHNSGSDRPIGSVSYGNRPMTRIVRKGQPSFQGVELWYLNEADIQSATSSTFSLTWSSGPPGATIHYASGLYEGVNQSFPINDTSAVASANGIPNPLTTTLNVVNSGYSIAVASHGSGSNSLIWNNGWSTQSNQTDAWATSGTGDHPDAADGIATVSVTAVNGISNRFVLAAVSLSPTSSGPPPPPDTIPPAPVLDLGALPGDNFVPGLAKGNGSCSGSTMIPSIFDPPRRKDPPLCSYLATLTRIA